MGLLLVGVRLRGSHAATVALTGADTVCGVYLSPPEYRNPLHGHTAYYTRVSPVLPGLLPCRKEGRASNSLPFRLDGHRSPPYGGYPVNSGKGR